MGAAHPDHLLAQLTARQVAEWKAFYDLEPWGEIRADFRAGQVCATIAEYAGKTRNADAPPTTPADFMPSLAEFSGKKKTTPDSRPRLLSDPAEQSKLLRKVLFKKGE